MRVYVRDGKAPTKVTKGHGSRAAGLAMAFKLIESAQGRWRAVNAPHLVALVRAGATFVNGKLVERPERRGRQGPSRKPPKDLDPQVLTITQRLAHKGDTVTVRTVVEVLQDSEETSKQGPDHSNPGLQR